ATSLMCTSPVFPPGNSTNAPKFLIPVTFPITLLPTSTDILIYYPPNYHLLSLYNNTIKKKNNHYNIVTIILPELLFQHFYRSIFTNNKQPLLIMRRKIHYVQSLQYSYHHTAALSAAQDLIPQSKIQP